MNPLDHPAPPAKPLSIVLDPAPILRQRCERVPEITDEVRSVAAEMIALMRAAKGIGLAAPQVGLPWRMFVTEVPPEGPMVYVNPSVEDTLGFVYAEEGCLSIPGFTGEVGRSPRATLKATDLEGRVVSRRETGLLARCWQHEMDHLNGVTILDKVNPLSLIAALRRERDASHRARLVLAPHPGATPADDTGCGCAVSSLEELAVAVVADRDKHKASLDQFLRDTSEAMSCLPGCDSQAHEELCPVVNPAAAWRMLNADRDRYRAAIEETSERWRKQAADAMAESSRIRSVVKAHTGAEERCVVRATIWKQCAEELDRALAPPTPAAKEPPC